MLLSLRRLTTLPRPVEQWQRNLWAVLATAVLFNVGFDLVNPFLPLFVFELGVNDFAAAALWSGLVIAITPLANAFVGPWWGSQADRRGRRRIVLISLTVYTVVAVLMTYARSPAELLLARGAMGLLGGFTNLSMVLATHGCPRERVGQVVGSLQSVQFVALAAVPPLGGLVVDGLGVRANCLVSAACFLVGVVLMAATYRELPVGPAAAVGSSTRPARERDQQPWWTLASLPGFAGTMVILFVAHFVDRGLFTVVPLFVTRLLGPGGGAGAATGLIIGLGALGVALSANLYGRLAAGRSLDRLLAVALAAGLVCILPMALVQTVELLTVLRVLLAVVAGGAATLAYTRAGRDLPASRSATGFSLLASSAMLGGALSPFLVGLLAGFDLRVVFVADALLYAVALGALGRQRLARFSPRAARPTAPLPPDASPGS